MKKEFWPKNEGLSSLKSYKKCNSYWSWKKLTNQELEKRRLWTINALEEAPDPEVVEVEETGKGTNTSLHYPVVIVFDASSLNKPTTVLGRFEPKDHSFTIHRWEPNATIEDCKKEKWLYNKTLDVSVEFLHKIYKYPKGAYYPWLHHKRTKPTKWARLNKGLNRKYLFTDRVILGHLFFKTEEDFKNWMGDEHYASMFIDLLN